MYIYVCLPFLAECVAGSDLMVWVSVTGFVWFAQSVWSSAGEVYPSASWWETQTGKLERKRRIIIIINNKSLSDWNNLWRKLSGSELDFCCRRRSSPVLLSAREDMSAGQTRLVALNPLCRSSCFLPPLLPLCEPVSLIVSLTVLREEGRSHPAAPPAGRKLSAHLCSLEPQLNIVRFTHSV